MTKTRITLVTVMLWLLANAATVLAQVPTAEEAFNQLLAGGDPANPVTEITGDGTVQADTELITVGTLGGNDNAYMLFSDNNTGDVYLTFRGDDSETINAWSEMTNGAFTTREETVLFVFKTTVIDQQSWTVSSASPAPMSTGSASGNIAGFIFDQAWEQQWGETAPVLDTWGGGPYGVFLGSASGSTYTGDPGNLSDPTEWTIVRIPRREPVPPNQPLPPGVPPHDSWMNNLQTPQPLPTFFPTPRPTPGPTNTPFVPPTPAPPPTRPPEPPPANCPPMDISQGDAKLTLSDAPGHPVVIGQDKTKRGVDLCVTVSNPPVIKTYWTWESECLREVWDEGEPGVEGDEEKVCVEERWYCDEHQEVYPDPIVMDTVNMGMTLSGDSIAWIEGELARRYPGARVINGSFNRLAPPGGWNAGLRADGTFTLGGCKRRIPVEDPGTWWDSFSATTTGTPYTRPRGLWKRLITRVWLLDTTLIE